jgi:hypothetical protein
MDRFLKLEMMDEAWFGWAQPKRLPALDRYVHIGMVGGRTKVEHFFIPVHTLKLIIGLARHAGFDQQDGVWRVKLRAFCMTSGRSSRLDEPGKKRQARPLRSCKTDEQVKCVDGQLTDWVEL